MNFKAIGLNVATATALIAGTALTTTPAQAAGLGYDLNSVTLNFKGDSFFDTSSGFFDFQSIDILSGRERDNKAFLGDGTSLSPTIEDLTLVSTGANTWSLGAGVTVNNFISGLANDISFRLDKFDLTRISREEIGGGTTLEDFEATLAGVFFSPDYSGGVETKNGLLFQIQIETGSGVQDGSYVGSVTTVPTPALLPGLVGLALGAMRKRKSEAAGEATEPVEVEA